MLKMIMKKKRLFLFLWVLLAGPYPTLAIQPSVNLLQQSVEKNGFFDKKADSVLRIGIRSWAKVSKKVIQRHWAIGTEIAIGPVIEWHPFNGIAIQSGVLYSYNSFFTVQFSVDHKNLLDRSASSFGSRVVDAINELSARSQGYIAYAGLDHIHFHAITFPFFCRIYPEKSRRFVIYGGPRLLFVLASLERKEYCPVHIDTRIIKDIFYDALKQGRAVAAEDGAAIGDLQPIVEEGLLKVYRSVFRLNPNLNQSTFSNNRCFYWDVVWEFGVEFRIKHRFVIGINGLGMVLGYDFFN